MNPVIFNIRNEVQVKLKMALLLLLLAACGDYDKDVAYGNTGQVAELQRVALGIYRVSFTPLNASIAGNVSGTSILTITPISFLVSMDITAPASTTHRQYLHWGESCPTESEDNNLDGFIDVIEASVVGGILVPLDGDLDSQLLGLGNFPLSSPEGQYVYAQNASLSAMLSDLFATDPDANDDLIKLSLQEEFNPEGRILQIYGVPQETVLPETVQTNTTGSAQTTLPIACGVITRFDTD